MDFPGPDELTSRQSRAVAQSLHQPSLSSAKRQRGLIAGALALGTRRQIFGEQVVLVVRRRDGLAAEGEHAQGANPVASNSLCAWGHRVPLLLVRSLALPASARLPGSCRIDFIAGAPVASVAPASRP